MSLFNIFNIAGSAMTAQSQRLNVVASNLANVDSATGPDGKPYQGKTGCIFHRADCRAAGRGSEGVGGGGRRLADENGVRTQ